MNQLRLSSSILSLSSLPERYWIFKAKSDKLISRSSANLSVITDHLFALSNQVCYYKSSILLPLFFHPPSDVSFTGSLDFWHQMVAPSRHFDTRSGKEAAAMANIIASVTIILSQMPHSPNHCNSCNCSIAQTKQS